MYQYAGIHNAQKLGKYGVEDTSKIVKRLAYSHYRLMMIEAAQLPARMNWHFKAGLAKSLYEDAQAMKAWVDRASELRNPQLQKMKSPDPWLELFWDELLMARSDYELWVGIYEIAKPEIQRLYKAYLEATQPLVDYPTVRLMKQAMTDLDDQLAWGLAIQPVLLDDAQFFTAHADQYDIIVDDEQSVKAYKEHLLELLHECGGIAGESADLNRTPIRWRSKEAFAIPVKAVRDPRMGGETIGRTGVKNQPLDNVLAGAAESARIRQEELGAAELIAATLVMQHGMPWEFYDDLSRHCWDEMRHTLYGQAVLDLGGFEWFTQPQFKGDYDPHMDKPVAASYVWLSVGVEGEAMKKEQMPKEARFYKKLAQESEEPFVKLLAQGIDFDWADEVTHHQYGRKWAEELVGGYGTAKLIADKEMALNNERMKEDTHKYWNGKVFSQRYIGS
ncbi:hypothetical protein [Paenibacillus eucommiae]|uniref:Uncharacterized protein n=1 Tax=Paenibacillus eucommiae TaxID=1355755 RepID=A0ABS4IQU5_9BACL|nr:hypothetical protein [Paenibacillus eucommiae]MBP1989934.1 hypothetical protein [Paenibacillus eucommiae]